jgi:hypothetical protein
MLAALAALAAVLLAGGGCIPTGPQPTSTPRATSTATSTTDLGLHAFPELEARLPEMISGRRLTTVSLSAHPDRQDPKTLAVLERLDRAASDLQLANGELTGYNLEIGALRIVGAEAAMIIAAFRAVDEADPGHVALYTPTTVAGKQVTARTVGVESSYLYGVDDIMFIVSGDQALVEAALAALP